MGPVTIRDLLVKFGVKADTGKVQQFDAAVETAKDGMLAATKIAAGLTAGLFGLLGAMGLGASEAADHAEALTQTAQILGVTTDELQELQHVFDQVPASAEGTTEALAALNQSTQEVLQGSQSMIDAWKLLGVGADKIKGKRLPELFELLADSYAHAESEQERLAAISTIFGEDLATKVAPALAGGAAGIRALREEARAYGLVLSEGVVKRGNAAKAQFQLLRGVISAVRLEIGSALIPAVLSVTNRTLEWVSSNREWMSLKIEQAATAIGDAFEWVQERIEDADEYVKDHLGGWRNLFTQIGKVLLVSGIAVAIPKIIGLLGTLKVVAVGVLAGISAAGWPVTLVVGAIVLAVGALLLILDDFAAWLRGGDSLLGRFLTALGLNERALESVGKLFESLTELGGHLRNAIGDLAGALGDKLAPVLAVVLEALRPVADFLAHRLKVNVAILIDDVDRLTGVIDLLSLAFTDWDAAVKTTGENIEYYLGKVKDAIDVVMGGVKALGVRGTLATAAGPGAQLQNWMIDGAYNTARDAAGTVQGAVSNAFSFGETNLSVTQPGASAEQIAAAIREGQQRMMRLAIEAAGGGER